MLNLTRKHRLCRFFTVEAFDFNKGGRLSAPFGTYGHQNPPSENSLPPPGGGKKCGRLFSRLKRIGKLRRCRKHFSIYVGRDSSKATRGVRFNIIISFSMDLAVSTDEPRALLPLHCENKSSSNLIEWRGKCWLALNSPAWRCANRPPSFPPLWCKAVFFVILIARYCWGFHGSLL